MNGDHDLLLRLMEPHRALLRLSQNERRARLAVQQHPGLRFRPLRRILCRLGDGLVWFGTRLRLSASLPDDV